MPSVSANNIQIEYETFGEPDSPPLLLIIGLGGQLIFWDEELCEQLAQQGHFVIRYDNRDSGLSSRLEEAAVPDAGQGEVGALAVELRELPFTSG